MSSTINKAELISKLQTLEGLTNDERSNLIGLLRQHKKYGLVWEDKTENIEERLREELPVLREVKEKALLIAKKLLSEKGVIFISIDDNEQANLKLLCDSVFGEQHFIANLIWQKKFSRSRRLMGKDTISLINWNIHIEDEAFIALDHDITVI